jgi:hypothetical protein
MLLFMQQTVTTEPSPAAPSFAGLLAALAAPAPKTAWNTDDLADDVATLSYEHALRTHARYKPVEPGDWGFAQAADLAAAQVEEARRTNETGESNSACEASRATMPMQTEWSEDAAPKPAQGGSTMYDRNLKCASITIRLSKAECDQLKSRAAAAGLTVSAYLRSCTFEAEALRAQVKEALAELRAASSTEAPRKPVKVRRSWFEWLVRLLPHGHPEQSLARA